MALLRVDEMGKLGRVSEEEVWRVISHEIPVTLVGAELDGEPARVASAVVRAGLATHGAKPDGNGAFPSLRAEEVGYRQVGDGTGALENSMCPRALSVHDTLGDALTIKVGKNIDQVEILQQEWPVFATSL